MAIFICIETPKNYINYKIGLLTYMANMIILNLRSCEKYKHRSLYSDLYGNIVF